MSRRLTSKRLRGALFIAADGRCQSCGKELGAGWHADHLVPWSKTKRTNVHEMRALCPRCNLAKGAKMKRANRTFQDELIKRAEEVAASGEKLTTAHITPGGGKTRGALLFAQVLLVLGVIKHIIYVGPRISLTWQTADAVGEVIPGKALRVANNETPLVRDDFQVGYVTTIQAVTANTDLHTHHADLNDSLLIVDEFHHLPGEGDGDDEDAAWTRSAKALAERCKYVLAMTGTNQRNKDSRGILWLDYDEDRRPLPCHVNYGRRQAIEEGAKLRFRPYFLGGRAKFERDGDDIETRIETPDARVKNSITWELSGNVPFVAEVVDKGMAHWKQHRKFNKRAQCLVVCRGQATAEEIYRKLKAEAVGYRVGLAISDKDEEARRVVKAYRGRDLEVMVSVDKAYEGLDAPATTHVICMRGVLSQPWIEQCLDRATRIDYLADGTPNPLKDTAHIFAPADPKMMELLRKIEAEQGDALPRQGPEGPEGPGGGEPVAELLAASVERIILDEGSADHAAQELIRERYGRSGTWEQVCAFGQAIALMDAPAKVEEEAPPAPPADLEARLRKEISKKARRRDYQEELEPGTTNYDIVAHFEKKRKHMGIKELQAVLEWLKTA